MMSSTFCPLMEQRPSYLSLRLSPGLHEDHGIPQDIPFLLYPSSLRGPRLMPYLSPFHPQGHLSVLECPLEPAFIQRRNERERQRVRTVNQGYAALRDHLPGHGADKRLSKVETLRAAISYIRYLQGLVEDGPSPGSSPGSSPGPRTV